MGWRWNPFWRWPRVSLLAVGLLMAWLFHRGAWPAVTVDVRAMLESDLHGRENYDRIQSLVQDEVVAVISVDCGTVFSPQGIDLIWRLSNALELQPGSLGVKSLTHAVRPVRRGLGFEMVPLVTRNPSLEELTALSEFCLGHPLVRNVMVSADGRHALILNSYPPSAGAGAARTTFCAALDGVLKPFRAEGYSIRVLALPCVEVEMLGAAWRDATVFLPSAVLLALGVLGFYFRSVGVVALIALGGAVPLVLLPLAGLSLGWSLDPYAFLLFPLLGAVHLALQTHCFDAWQRAGLGCTDTREAMEIGLREVFRPALFALLTTGIGLLSLCLSPVAPVRSFGAWGACGAALILLSTFGPGLALLLVLPRSWLRSRARGRRAEGFTGVNRLARWLSERPAGVWGWVAVVLLAAVWGLAKIRTDVRVLEFLGKQSETRTTVELFDRVYGGVNVLTLEVDSGKAGGANGMEFLRYLQAVAEHAQKQTEVTAVYSYDQVVAMANEIWEGGQPGSFRLPDDPRRVVMFAAALGGFRFPLLETLVDADFRTATWIIRTPDMPSTRYLELVDRIVAQAQAIRPEGVSLSAARGLHAILESDRRILRSQLGSGAGSFLAIGLALLLLWRSLTLTILAMTATAVPVVVALAGLGHGGIPLNSITVMVGAVCLGIAVDHSVHFLTHWRQGVQRGLLPAAALGRTLEQKSGPVTVSTLVLAGVFSLMMTGSFPPVAAFGGLASAAFLMTWATVLLGVPKGLAGRRVDGHGESSAGRG